MVNEFTPGPWRATKAGATIVESQGRVIAWPAKGSPHSVDSNIERAANAHLIARSPSMLTLLEKAMLKIEAEAERRESIGAEHEGEYWIEMRELANEIKAEIAKARGGQ